MPELYSDDNGARVIVRHKGPAGRGFPEGGTTGQILAKTSADDYDAQWVNPPDGTDAVLGPVSAANNNVAVFDGLTGKLIKDGGQPLSNYASVSLVGTKQDSEAGKGLSQENFTTVLKDKLDGLSEHYRGTYASAALVASEIADPVAGDYAFVEVLGEDQVVLFWDDTNSEWSSKEPVQMTGQEIADVLFDTEDAAAWDKDTCRIFTETEKAQLAAIQSLVDSLGLSDLTKAYGTISAFSASGSPFPATTLAGASDGTTNLAIVNVSTGALLGSYAENFDNGGVTTGRLRYTGATTKKFLVNASICLSSALVSGSLLAGIAKNGVTVTESRQRVGWVTGSSSVTIHMTCVVEMSTNQYLELTVGNFSGSEDITVSSLVISANVIQH